MSEVSGELNSTQRSKDQLGNSNSAEKPVKSRLGKISPAIKKVAGKVILGTPLAGLLISSSGIDNPNLPLHLPLPNIKEPTPVSSSLPQNTIHNTDILRPYPPQSPTENKTIQKENKELVPFAPSITIVDFFPPKTTEGFYQGKFLSPEQIITRAVATRINQDIKSAVKNPEVYVMLGALASGYSVHGEDVSRVMRKIWEKDGLQAGKTNISPLQSIIGSSDITPFVDEMGNPGISLSFEPEKIIDLLKSDRSKGINGSFQVGNVEFILQKKEKIIKEPDPIPHKYEFETGKGEDVNLQNVYLVSPSDWSYRYSPRDKNIMVPVDGAGNPIKPITVDRFNEMKAQRKKEAEANARVEEYKEPRLRIVGSYTKEKAQENLPKLFEVCDAYPDKLFVFAAGNFGEDLRDTLRLLADQRPQNLLIVAEWREYIGGPQGKVYGADIYVPNSKLGMGEGSSLSTSVISAYAAELFNKGMSQEQVKNTILNNTKLHEYYVDGEKNKARVFNPSKIQEK